MYIYRYYLCMYITRRAAGFLLVRVLPPVWNLMAVSLIPLFYGTLVIWPSPIAFLSSFFCYWPINLPFISLNLIFLKDRLFRLAIVLFLSR